MALNLGLGDLDRIDLEGADFEDIFLSTIVGVFKEKKRRERRKKTSKKICWTGVPEKLYIEELLTCGHEIRIYEVLRMNLIFFNALQDWCLEHTNFKSF